jgi:hypothetical protein
MALEDALISSANGDFGLILLAFLIISVVASFIWMMRTVIEQNAGFNREILTRMDLLIAGMKEYKGETITAVERYKDCTSQALKEHDLQAKKILESQQEMTTTLQNRPCINGK